MFSPPLIAHGTHGDSTDSTDSAVDCHAAAAQHQDYAASGYDQDVIAGESTPSIGVLSVLVMVVTFFSQQTHALPAGSECTPAVQFPPGHLVRTATPPPRPA